MQPTVTFPNLVMAIEKPELFQHPNRQRHFAKTLLQLAQRAIPGVAEKKQVIYATHSPLFVGLDRFNQIRRLNKKLMAIRWKSCKTLTEIVLSIFNLTSGDCRDQ